MNEIKYGTKIPRCTKPKLDILKYCESINFYPGTTALRILSKYGDIVIGENRILGFDSINHSNDDETPLIIQTTKYEQTHGLPEGYLVIQRFAIGKYRPYRLIIMDKYAILYQCQLTNGIIKTDSIEPLRASFAEYISELFTNWTLKHFV